MSENNGRMPPAGLPRGDGMPWTHVAVALGKVLRRLLGKQLEEWLADHLLGTAAVSAAIARTNAVDWYVGEAGPLVASFESDGGCRFELYYDLHGRQKKRKAKRGKELYGKVTLVIDGQGQLAPLEDVVCCNPLLDQNLDEEPEA